VYNANGVEKQKETITISELKKIKNAVVTDELDLESPSVLNRNFSKAQAVENLFAILEESHDDESVIHYMVFENVLREFVIGRKRMDDSWKEVELI